MAWGGDRLVEAPQLLAELVLVAAAYGIGRRLGFRPAASLFAALLVPTLAEVALQSTTTQTDLLVAASLAAAVYFILGGTGRELALAGLGLGLAAATKQTIVFALPGLLLLAAVTLDRRGLLRLGAWTAGGVVLVASWGPVRNLVETGHLLGEGSRARGAPGRPGSARARDRGARGLPAARPLRLDGRAGAGARARRGRGCGRLGLRARRRDGARLAPVVAVLVLAGPLVVAVTAGAIGAAAERLNVPINPPETTSGPFAWHVNRRAHEDFAYFGPLVALVLLPVCAVCAFCGLRGGGDRRRAALALGLPLFVVTMSLIYKYNPFLGRFLVIPVVLSLPLVAIVLRYRAAAAGVAALAAASLVVVHAHNELKPLGDEPIWMLDRAATFALNAEGLGPAVEALEARVPEDGTIGALLGVDDAAYPLFGPDLRRRVRYLPHDDPLRAAERLGLRLSRSDRRRRDERSARALAGVSARSAPPTGGWRDGSRQADRQEWARCWTTSWN